MGVIVTPYLNFCYNNDGRINFIHWNIKDFDLKARLVFSQELYPGWFAHLHGVICKLKVMTDWLRSESDRDSLPDVNAMLSLTYRHSTLYVLQNTTDFVSLDHDKLRQLLVQLEG